MPEPITLKTLLAESAHTRALHGGEVASPLVKLDLAPVRKANTAFKPFVRENAFDAGELAIVTYLQARERGFPYVLLPATIVGRFQHHCIAYNIDRGALSPADLKGKRIGVRAYTQTTGMWVRGILQNDYGADMGSCEIVTFEDAHVPGYINPPNVTLAPEGKALKDMLLDGELDAAMLGEEMPDDPRLRTVIPDAQAEALRWHARTQAIPVNHLMILRADISRDRPDVAAELHRMLKEAKALAGPPGDPDTRPFSVEGLRRGLDLAIRYSLQQGLITQPVTVDDLFDDSTRILE